MTFVGRTLTCSQYTACPVCLRAIQPLVVGDAWRSSTHAQATQLCMWRAGISPEQELHNPSPCPATRQTEGACTVSSSSSPLAEWRCFIKEPSHLNQLCFSRAGIASSQSRSCCQADGGSLRCRTLRPMPDAADEGANEGAAWSCPSLSRSGCSMWPLLARPRPRPLSRPLAAPAPEGLKGNVSGI